MHSGIYTLTALPDAEQGYVILGTISRKHYCHYGPGIVPPAEAVPVFVPDAPFRWADFAAAHPALAAKLLPHQWVGE